VEESAFCKVVEAEGTMKRGKEEVDRENTNGRKKK
jgi:hypothetical protein